MGDSAAWSIAGSYLEACNCEAICPCRRIGGAAGGRSTYGVCMGALSWLVERGHLGELDLSGLSAVIACRYCQRRGRYPLTALVVRYGIAATWDDVLRDLSANCTAAADRTGKSGCNGAYLAD